VRRAFVVLVILLLSAAIAWWLGQSGPAIAQSPLPSPLRSPLSMLYIPVVMGGDKAFPPAAAPVNLQGVGHDRKWVQGEADWLCPALTMSGVEWYHDWTPYPIQCAGVEAVPMIWDETQIHVSVQGNSEWLQVFNEPEFQSQANLTPHEAAAYYRYVESLHPDKKLIGPAVVHLWWSEDFHFYYEQQYGEQPRMDALAIHSYPQIPGDALASTLIQRSINDVQAAIDFAAEHGIPEVWVTEFAVQPRGDPQKPIDYMTAMIAWFQAQPTVTRWAWFALDLTDFWWGEYDTSLVLDGALTPFGEVYSQ